MVENCLLESRKAGEPPPPTLHLCNANAFWRKNVHFMSANLLCHQSRKLSGIFLRPFPGSFWAWRVVHIGIPSFPQVYAAKCYSRSLMQWFSSSKSSPFIKIRTGTGIALIMEGERTSFFEINNLASAYPVINPIRKTRFIRWHYWRLNILLLRWRRDPY